MRKFIVSTLILIALSSCSQLLNIAKQVDLNSLSTSTPTITNSDNVSGLKSALGVGIEKAVYNLSAENGFFGNAALKILLPEEAQPIIDNINLIPGGQALLDKAILSLNRSAEDAVKEATPIFKNAILNMSITDATNIVFGADSAATAYLRKNTFNQLKSAFSPKVSESLSKPLVASMSTSEIWSGLSNTYNKVAGSTVGRLAGLKSVDVNLGDYVTDKALDALFVKVADEEKLIREDPIARINDVLKLVFGQLDKK
jgi:hypothetical protein